MKPSYSIAVERGDLNYFELEPLYRQHYAEMQARMARDGFPIPDFKPRLDVYFDAWEKQWLMNFVARFEGEAVGYANVYFTHDMHNGEPIGQEDTLYVVPQHRKGIGKEITRFALSELEKRGAKRVFITPVTDLRVAKIWRRMGFRDVASQMVYTF